ncbi:MAG: phosphoribosyl-ATP diphosphatase [Alkalispirochaeta sp.]
MADTLLIYDSDSDGRVVAVAGCNEKSRNKSLEQRELWIVDPDSGRVLPYAHGGVSYDRFVQRASWWEVRVTEPGASDGSTTAPAAQDPAYSSPHDDGTTGAQVDSHEPATAAGTAAAGMSPPPTAAPGLVAPSDPILTALGDLIAERRRTMPEGSYTTHLFTKGPEKIRKKVGEEAVELILAADPEEIRAEAADLVYHMMVLLEVEGLSMDHVLTELDRRHRSG